MDPAEFDAMARVQRHHWWFRALRGLLTDALAHMPARDDGRPLILDAGCGTGANLPALAALGKAYGIDYSSHALSRLDGAGVARADGRRLPFPGAAFDAFVSCDVLCHEAAGEPAEHLREAWRVLRPGGVLVLNLPAYPWMCSAHDRAVANARRFGRGEVVPLITGAGFDIVRATHWNALLLPVAMVKRHLSAGSGASNLARAPGVLEQAIGRTATGLERVWLRFAGLPAGLSIFVVARKPAGAVDSNHG